MFRRRRRRRRGEKSFKRRFDVFVEKRTKKEQKPAKLKLRGKQGTKGGGTLLNLLFMALKIREIVGAVWGGSIGEMT